MKVTVAEAMIVGGLAHCNIVAGKNGIDREIEYVTVMEVPDVIEWLNGKDFLLTSLYAIKDDIQAQSELVYQLVEKGCAALAIKTHRFFDEIPECILEAANNLKFPIIEIDKDVKYIDIITPLTGLILDKQSFDREHIENFFYVLSEMAMEGKNFSMLIEIIEKFIHNFVTLESEVSDVLLFRNTNSVITPLTISQRTALLKTKRALGMTRKLDGVVLPCIVAPIILNGELEGILTCWQTVRTFTQNDLSILERVIPLLSLQILEVRTKIEVEQKYKNDFMSEILLGNIPSDEEINEKSRLFHWDLSMDYVVSIFDIDHVKRLIENKLDNELSFQGFKQRGLKSIERLAQDKFRKVIIILWNDKFILLCPYDRYEDQVTIINHLKIEMEEIQKKLIKDIPEYTFTVGISRPYPGINGLREGYAEASKAIQLGRPIYGHNTCIYFGELGVYRILSLLKENLDVKLFYDETIGQLLTYDLTHDAHLTESLIAYFNRDFNVVDAAKDLFVHPNTIKYRLQRIEEVTGCCLQESEGRLKLHLGLKISKILN
ncbi:PucR family transcriptional regulator [Sulfoacidibacillus ferrooxidans]|uniref:PucR family transcriptional regulator n=1 Tax=Sulfoacidibacillus ferrooxidans TaxID=2005001 RepID=UPI001F50E2AD